MNNQLHSTIHKSGNSDVDINIQIETASLAYMYACSLYATGQVNDRQFEEMLQHYHHLVDTEKKRGTGYIRTPVKRLHPPKKLQ